MNSVDRVKTICRERRIAISKLEKDLGFGNGYIGQLKKGVFPNDRLYKIAEYLEVSPEYIATGKGPENKKTATTQGDGVNENDELLDYILDTVKQFPIDLKIRAANGIQSLKQELLTRDK